MKKQLSRLVVLAVLVSAIGFTAMVAGASPSRLSVSGTVVGPSASTCEAWQNFGGTGDFTKPVVGEFSVRQLGGVAPDGTVSLGVRLQANLPETGPAIIVQNDDLVSHGHIGCTPNQVVDNSALVDNHQRLRSASFQTTWKWNGTVNDNGPQFYIVTSNGDIYRTRPIAEVFSLIFPN